MNIAILLFTIFIIVLLSLASWQVVIACYAKDDTGDHAEFFFLSGVIGAVLLGAMTIASVWIRKTYAFARQTGK